MGRTGLSDGPAYPGCASGRRLTKESEGAVDARCRRGGGGAERTDRRRRAGPARLLRGRLRSRGHGRRRRPDRGAHPARLPARPLLGRAPAGHRLARLQRDAAGASTAWSGCTPELPMAHPFPDGTAAVLSRSVAETAASFGPRDAGTYRRLVAPFLGTAGTPWRGTSCPCRCTALPRDPVTLARFGLTGLPPSTWLMRRFRDDRARALFAGLVAHVIAPLGGIATGAVGLVFALAAHARRLARGRAAARSRSPTRSPRTCSDLGGAVHTGYEVKRLDDLPPARAYVFDTSPTALARIAGLRARTTSGYRYGAAVFKIDYALDGPVPWTAEEARAGPAPSRSARAAREIDAALQRGLPGGPRPGRAVPHHRAAQPRRPRPGARGQARVLGVRARPERLGRRPHRRDRAPAGALRARASATCVLARATAGPPELAARNANYVGGDIACGAASGLQLLLRPKLSLSPYTHRRTRRSSSAPRPPRRARACTACPATTRPRPCGGDLRKALMARITLVQGDITAAERRRDRQRRELLAARRRRGRRRHPPARRPRDPGGLRGPARARTTARACATGQAVATTAGRLDAAQVIHTVGPVWSRERGPLGAAGLLLPRVAAGRRRTGGPYGRLPGRSPPASTAGRWTTPPASRWRPYGRPRRRSRRSGSCSSTSGRTRPSRRRPADRPTRRPTRSHKVRQDHCSDCVRVLGFSVAQYVSLSSAVAFCPDINFRLSVASTSSTELTLPQFAHPTCRTEEGHSHAAPAPARPDASRQPPSTA